MPSQNQPSSQNTGCLFIFVIILGLYQILFASRVLLHTGFNLDSWSLSALIQFSMATLWAILFVHATIRIGKNSPYALRYSGWLIVIFAISRLIQTIVFVQADYDRNRLGFLIIVTLMILAVPLMLLIQQRENGTQN